jgi:hypothetical protein
MLNLDENLAPWQTLAYFTGEVQDMKKNYNVVNWQPARSADLKFFFLSSSLSFFFVFVILQS